MRILIANRGEIARRIIRTAHRLGHETVAVFAEPDRHAPHVAEATIAVEIGPAALSESYLSSDRLIAAATETRATAVHPGYGFLAENADFARAVQAAGLIWIGPRPSAIDNMGSKIDARQLAESAGVPIIPGFSASQDPAELRAAAERIGFPILVKAASGGGGKGIRIANTPADFDTALAEASSEAQRSFGDGDVIVERYIERPRHIEVQIIGDKRGGIAELGTRECSVQRRYQKLLEEAPAPNLSAETRRGLRSSALALAKSIGYDSAGTVEFVVDAETGDHFFLEMNTRLQVEHPVTELITGVDLVELMIRVAAGEPLPLRADQLAFEGHAIEARIAAENPSVGFAPQIGTVHHVVVPHGVRWDAAVEPGSEITPHYDSMIAKLIVWGRTRAEALDRLRRALDELIIGGVTTTAGFHRWLIDQPAIVNATVTTRFLDETPVPASPEPAADLAAAAWVAAQVGSAATSSPWTARAGFSLTPSRSQCLVGLRDDAGDVHERAIGAEAVATAPAVVDLVARRVSVNVDGHTHSFEVPSRTERWAPSITGRKGTGAALVAPFPALVSEVNVAPGDELAGDEVLVVIEAMKMLHSLRATGAATVDEVRVAPGDQVATDDILVTFVTPDEA